MTLPWYLNPWAEVRRLREYIHFCWSQDCLDQTVLRQVYSKKIRRIETENADLRQRIAEMEEQAGIEQRRTDYIRRAAG